MNVVSGQQSVTFLGYNNNALPEKYFDSSLLFTAPLRECYASFLSRIPFFLEKRSGFNLLIGVLLHKCGWRAGLLKSLDTSILVLMVAFMKLSVK